MKQQRWLAAIPLTALVGLSACSETTSPSATPHDIVVTLDWPLVREPDFSDASWRLVLAKDDALVQQGEFASDGTAVLAFRVTCSESGFALTKHQVQVSGRFANNEWVCHWRDVKCFQDPQQFAFPAETGRPCGPPDN